MGRKNLYFDEEAEILWAKKFAASEISGSSWLKSKLKEEEELEKSKDPKIIQADLDNLYYQRSILDANIKRKEDLLKVALKDKAEQEKRIVKINPYQLQAQKKAMGELFNLDENQAKELATQYLSIDIDDRPDMPSFVKKKLLALQQEAEAKLQ